MVKSSPHLAAGKFAATTPTASHPRPRWAPDEIECRVLLMLPYTNLTPASLRHTMTAERQNRVVALRNINVLAAAQTYRHMSGAIRTAIRCVCPTSSSTSSILRLVWNGSLHFPRAGMPQDHSSGASEGYGCGRFGVRDRLRGTEWESTLNLAFLPRRSRCSETAGRLEQPVKCARIWFAVSLDPQRQPHGIRWPGGRPRWLSSFSLVGPSCSPEVRLPAGSGIL